MISITCTNCRTVLTIDDAFAGGVCRCQQCGTIQTVPSHLKANARPAAPNQSQPGSKTLYQHKPNADMGTGLDDLAGAVASSGLSSGRLRSATATRTAPKRASATAPQKKSPILLIVIIGVVIVAAAAGGIVYMMHNSSSPAPGDQAVAPPPPAPTDNPPTTPSGPSFCGVPLIEGSVVYVLDRGTATEQFFDPLKGALYRSLDLIGGTSQFAVILSDNGSAPVMYPRTGLANATPDQVQKTRSLLDDAIASGSSKLGPAIKDAVARKPSVLIVVTAKWSLDPADAESLIQNAQRGIRIHTFILGESTSTDALQQAASRSGGIFRRVSEADLRRFGS